MNVVAEASAMPPQPRAGAGNRAADRGGVPSARKGVGRRPGVRSAPANPAGGPAADAGHPPWARVRRA